MNETLGRGTVPQTVIADCCTNMVSPFGPRSILKPEPSLSPDLPQSALAVETEKQSMKAPRRLKQTNKDGLNFGLPVIVITFLGVFNLFTNVE